jgi:succinoglycan biosynthesis transport protein ExoP
VIVIAVLVCTVLAALYLFTEPKRYTSIAKMVIDTRKVQLLQQQSVMGEVPVDSGQVETQVEVLKSDNISLSVIKDLRLTEDPEFVGPSAGLFGAVFQLMNRFFDSGTVKSDAQLTGTALSRFNNARAVRRLGLTYAMEIEFSALGSERAAQIANALVDAYIVDQLEAKYQATRRASVWLQDRIRELRTQAASAEQAALDYKVQNNIVDLRVDGAGRLMGEQQLAEITSQLVLARAATAEARARYNRMQEIMRQEIPDASVTDALKNDVIVRLRGQYLDLKTREATFSAKYGYNHLAPVNLRNQMQELRRAITDELQRIAEAYKSDYDIAKARESSLSDSLTNIVSQSQATRQAQLGLRELDGNAQTFRSLHDNFLQRYMEAIQQQSFPITEARLISPASPEQVTTRPKAIIVFAIFMAAGLMLGVGVAAARELSDNAFRTTAAVQQSLHANCIAVFPAVKVAADNGSQSLLEAPNVNGRKAVRGPAGLLKYVVQSPLSPFAEELRSIKVALDLNRVLKPHKVLGLTSALPNEGKSTIAANLAFLIAQSGGRVVLLDADFRNPSLSRALAPDAELGLIHVIGGKASIEEVLVTDTDTKLKIIPSGAKSKLIHSSELMGSDAFKKVMDELRLMYDYIIVDLPPLAPVVDVRASTQLIDSYVFVIEWGKTSINLVERSLMQARGVYDGLLGVVLNKADLAALSRYESFQSYRSYRQYYARYGYVD